MEYKIARGLDFKKKETLKSIDLLVKIRGK